MKQFAGVSKQGPFSTPEQRYQAGRLGMALFLASLAMLFCATIVGFVVIRVQSEGWAALDLPALPAGMWLSTALLVASSGSMHWALRSAKTGRSFGLKAAMGITAGLGLGFLLLQSQAWIAWTAALEPVLKDIEDEQLRFAAMGFYLLTGIHAVHVIGGVGPLLWITGRSVAGAYHARRWAPVYFIAMYWHFLDVVWVLLFLTLLAGV